MFSDKKKRFIAAEVIAAVLIAIFGSSGLISFNIGNAAPFLLLPLTICVAMYRGEVTGLFFGLFCGLLADTCSVTDISYNTLFLSIIGFGVGILVTFLFNRNLPAAIALATLGSFLYFGIKWFVFCYIPDVEGKMFFLLNFSLPSALYTSLFSLPFYFGERFLALRKKKKSELM